MTDEPTPQQGLPVEVIDHSVTQKQIPAQRRRLWIIPLLMLTMALGGFVGLYFQPPGLRVFFQVTGLEPGGGSQRPFALPAGVVLPEDVVETLVASDVVALARLMPRGDLSIVAPPFGSTGARVAEILVTEGEQVAAGQVLATLDNMAELEGTIATAQANVAVAQANLAQTRHNVATTRAIDQASLAEAQAIARVAQSEMERAQSLFDRGITTRAELDQSISTAERTERAVERAQAQLSRYTGDDPDQQADVVVAARNLEAARTELRRRKLDLNKSRILAPTGGTVLDIAVHPGEAVGADGAMTLGDVSQMMAEVEVHQSQIAAIRVGQPVQLLAEGVQLTADGRVEQIGLLVQRQAIVGTDTAANTDARVVKVLVRLSQDHSALAARFSNLEVIARIDTREFEK